VPFGFFRTADGFLALACPKEKFFRALASAIDRVDLTDDPRFVPFEARLHHRTELMAILNERLAEATTADWLQRLRGVVPVAPVRSVEDALDLDELRGRNMLAEFLQPEFRPVRSVGLPITTGGYTPHRAGPRLGEHGHELLQELGYTTVEIATLSRVGAFGGTLTSNESGRPSSVATDSSP